MEDCSLNRVILSSVALTLTLGCLAGCQEKQARPVDTDRQSGFGNQSTSMAGATGDGALAVLIEDDSTDAGLDGLEDSGMALVDAEVDSAVFEIVPFAVETRVGERRTPAGLENRITCQVLDQVGEPIVDLQSEAEINPDTGFERFERIEPVFGSGGVPAPGGFALEPIGGEPIGGAIGGMIALPDGLPMGGGVVEERKVSGAIGLIAREYEVACAAPALGLRDPSPALWTVVPGPAHRVITQLNRGQINAGETIDVSCTSFDRFGNQRNDNEYDISVVPAPRRVSRNGSELLIEGAGRFDVQCKLPGVEEYQTAPVEIRAGLPANLSVTVFPDRPVHRTGSVVELIPQVTDRFGNPVSPVTLEFFSEPNLPSFGEGRFQANTPGEYDVGVRVVSATQDDVELVADRKIIVAFDGPGIDCTEPEMGQVIVRARGHADLGGAGEPGR